MIRAEIRGNLARLASHAALIAERRLRRKGDRRWRSAAWLWPLFPRGDG